MENQNNQKRQELISLLNNLLELVDLDAVKLSEFMPSHSPSELDALEESNTRLEITTGKDDSISGINPLLIINTILNILVDDTFSYIVDNNNIIRKICWKSEL